MSLRRELEYAEVRVEKNELQGAGLECEVTGRTCVF